MRRLALFDLDHTLLPLDSDYEWALALVRLGAVDGERYQAENARFYAQYQAGTLDMAEFLRFSLAPLARYPRATLDAWHQGYMRDVIRPQIHAAARALVADHQRAGDLCLLVTATNRFVTAPIAREFGLPADALIATDIEETAAGEFTGRPRGTPAFREGKITGTEAWLAARGLGWDSFASSTFYSDSINDVPLLERVTAPVATNPDDRLRALALERGWRVLDLFPRP